MSIAYVPNTERNRRLIKKHLPRKGKDSRDFKSTEVRWVTFDGEEIRSYIWKFNHEQYHIQTWYFDVLKSFVKEAGFRGVTYSHFPRPRSYKYKAIPQPKKSRKNAGSRLLRLFGL